MRVNRYDIEPYLCVCEGEGVGVWLKEGVGSKREIVLVFKRVRWSVVERQSVRERERERVCA